MPETWKIESISPIYKKKGGEDERKNYRGITVMKKKNEGKMFSNVWYMKVNVVKEVSTVVQNTLRPQLLRMSNRSYTPPVGVAQIPSRR